MTLVIFLPSDHSPRRLGGRAVKRDQFPDTHLYTFDLTVGINSVLTFSAGEISTLIVDALFALDEQGVLFPARDCTGRPTSDGWHGADWLPAFQAKPATQWDLPKPLPEELLVAIETHKPYGRGRGRNACLQQHASER